MPEYIIAGNWKMNTTLQEAMDLVSAMRPRLDTIEGVRTVVCPPFVSLAAVAEILRGSTVEVGAQNVHHESQGAFTGEVSLAMLSDLCRVVILGHSERRQLFGETDEMVNLKVKAALDAGLRPILCVGEELEDREQGRAGEVVVRQLRGCLAGVDSLDDLAVAYEPIWAIGTGKAATPDVAQSLMAQMRGALASLFGVEAAAQTPLLYGGSVNPGNISDFMKEKDIDGALVGGASLSVDSFVEIVQRAADVKALSPTD